MDKRNFYSSILVFLFLILAFDFANRLALSNSNLGWIIFFTIFIVGIIGSTLFRRYKDVKASPQAIVLTYSALLVLMIITL